MTHPQAPRQFQVNHKGSRVGSGPIPEIPTPSPRRLEFSSHSLAHESMSYKNNWQTSKVGPLSPFEMAHTACGVCFPQASHLLRWPILSGCVSLWINPFLTYHFVSHWILSAMRHQDLSFISPEAKTWSQLKSGVEVPNLGYLVFTKRWGHSCTGL